MHLSSTAAVRMLAAWQQQRRELSDRLDTLLLHGPTAVRRVASRADELRAALDAERAAFEAFVDVVAASGKAQAKGQPGQGQPVEALEATTAGDVGLAEPSPLPARYPRLRSVVDLGP